jgi:hypothetical protein
LASAYKRSLEIARADGIRKIDFPCISTGGACGYPLEVAAKVAMRTVGEFLQANDGYFDEITFCCFRANDVEIYRELIGQEQEYERFFKIFTDEQNYNIFGILGSVIPYWKRVSRDCSCFCWI